MTMRFPDAAGLYLDLLSHGADFQRDVHGRGTGDLQHDSRLHKFREPVTEGSFCLTDPAAAFLGFAKVGFPCAIWIAFKALKLSNVI